MPHSSLNNGKNGAPTPKSHGYCAVKSTVEYHSWREGEDPVVQARKKGRAKGWATRRLMAGGGGWVWGGDGCGEDCGSDDVSLLLGNRPFHRGSRGPIFPAEVYMGVSNAFGTSHPALPWSRLSTDEGYY